MKRMRLNGRWPAIGVAVGAALLALVGTAIAESGPATTSASVAKALKQANKASRKATKAIRIARRTSKQQGPKGNTGPQGPKGDAGPQGAPGVSGLVIVEAATPSDSVNTKEEGVECPAGKRVFGGGAIVEGAFTFVAVDLSAPVSATTWLAAAHEHDETAEDWELQVYAICGNAT
jgi:hypothetical protein